jgi:hypothetical protein
MREQLEKTARNEALWRHFNNRVDEVDETFRVLPDDSLLTFHCECGAEGCSEMVSVTPQEYREARADVDRFIVHPGHEHDEIERTIKSNARYTLVDKRPEVERLVGADGLPDSGR